MAEVRDAGRGTDEKSYRKGGNHSTKKRDRSSSIPGTEIEAFDSS